MYYAITDALVGAIVMTFTVVIVAGIVTAGGFVLRAMYRKLKGYEETS